MTQTFKYSILQWGDYVKIVNFELDIENIISVYKGSIAPSHVHCKSRYSDCFVFVLTGEASYTFDTVTKTAKAGDIIFLAKGSRYFIDVESDNYTFYFIDFNFKNEQNTVFENEIYTSKSFLVLENSFKEFYDLWQIGNFAENIYCKSIIYNIYYKIVRSRLNAYVSKENRKKIEEIALFVAQNISDPNLSVAVLSEMCGQSEVHFRRIFHQIYHTSPIKFINLLRIKKGKELLTTTNLKIAEISRLTGFENQYYFAKKFKSETHLTPSEYRKLYFVK